jgi:hypothetical protein
MDPAIAGSIKGVGGWVIQINKGNRKTICFWTLAEVKSAVFEDRRASVGFLWFKSVRRSVRLPVRSSTDL